MTFPFLRRTIRPMALTPLYTATEIDAEIAQAKIDLAAARKAISRAIGTGISNRSSMRERVDVLQRHLEWLQSQRAALQIGPGAQAHVGRPAR